MEGLRFPNLSPKRELSPKNSEDVYLYFSICFISFSALLLFSLDKLFFIDSF